jgi:RNA polymerase sigma-70 factor (ECF subfamily)
MDGTLPSRFPKTSWTIVLAAAHKPTEDSRTALARLCEAYWKPVYAFVRRSGHDRERAQDLTQEFFALLIEKDWVKVADPQRGRFRSFLLTAVKHFLANEYDRTQRLKRGGGQVPLSMDLIDAETWYAPATTDSATPERLFERRWALSLLERAMANLRTEFIEAGKARHFESLKPFLNRESDGARYAELAGQMGVSPGSLRTLVHRMRGRYRELVRAEIAETVVTPEDIDEEIRFLLSVMSA